MVEAASTIEPPRRPLPGGPLALDLVNTVWQVDGEMVDWFDADEAVAEFTASHGRKTRSADLGATREALSEVRDHIRRLLDASVADAARPPAPSSGPVAADLMDDINLALGSARTVLEQGEPGPVLRTTGDQPWNQLAIEALIDAIRLAQERPDRIRRCEHEACILWFLDTSKAGRRRWCSMATCGNRTKARRHYARSSAEARSSS